MGRIKNKYHVIDILSYSYITSDACYLLFKSSLTLRKILLEIYKTVLSETKPSIYQPPNPFDFACHSRRLILSYPSYPYSFFPSTPKTPPHGNHFIVHNDIQLGFVLKFFTIKCTQYVSLSSDSVTLEWDQDGRKHLSMFYQKQLLSHLTTMAQKGLQIKLIVGCYQEGLEMIVE